MCCFSLQIYSVFIYIFITFFFILFPYYDRIPPPPCIPPPPMTVLPPPPPMTVLSPSPPMTVLPPPPPFPSPGSAVSAGLGPEAQDHNQAIKLKSVGAHVMAPCSHDAPCPMHVSGKLGRGARGRELVMRLAPCMSVAGFRGHACEYQGLGDMHVSIRV